MAIFRKIHTSFWSDSFTSDLERDKKLFYLYLLTNERTSQCGIYEITKKQIAYDLGYSTDTVSKLINEFEKLGKIKYNETTKEVAIKNWLKYNGSTSPKVQSCINKELSTIKDTVLIEYLNSIHTHPQEEEEEEQEQTEEKNKNREAAKAATLKRISDFKKSLYPFTIAEGGIYRNDTVKDFFEYWSELNKSETKMRWELQTTFQISKRLVTWLKNEKPKFGEPKQQTNIFRTTD